MSVLYPKAKQALLSGEFVWGGGGNDFKVALLDTDVYTYNASHEFYTDLSGVVCVSANLTGLTNTNGQADAENVNFVSVSGESIEAVAIYKDTGNPATSRLFAYIDSATGLPLTPNSGEVDLIWGSYIFAV